MAGEECLQGAGNHGSKVALLQVLVEQRFQATPDDGAVDRHAVVGFGRITKAQERLPIFWVRLAQQASESGQSYNTLNTRGNI